MVFNQHTVWLCLADLEPVVVGPVDLVVPVCELDEEPPAAVAGHLV